MKLFFALPAFLLLSVTPAMADSTVVGGSLLDHADANQLAGWLGQGDLVFTRIFNRTGVANDSLNFHTAADGQGPTFSIFQTNLGLVGGYNPVSWNGSLNSYNYTINNADRTAFLFNLDTNLRLTQRLSSEGLYQTYNYSGYGPTFGGGHDLVTYASNLSFGYAYGFTYGTGTNVFGAPSYNQPGATQQFFNITGLEVYTFAPAAPPPPPAVPEPGTGLLFATATAALIAMRRVKKS